MTTINLRKYYPYYKEDVFTEITEEMYEAILFSVRQENNYNSRAYYHKAYYSLNCNDGMENKSLKSISSPEDILIQKVSINQLTEAIKSLSPRQATRVYKYYILQQKMAEIAREEHVSVSTICKVVAKGLVNIEKYYIAKKWI